MKKILVRLPSGAEKIIASYGFLQNLRAEFPDSAIQVLVNEQDYTYSHYLREQIEWYAIPSDKMNLPGAHHFAVNLSDVFNIDLYFDLESTTHSVVLGLTFKPAMSIGFRSLYNRFVYSKVINPVEQMPLDRSYLFLLEEYLGKTLQDTKAFAELPTAIGYLTGDSEESESPDYLVLYWEDVKNEENFKELWKCFLDSFHGQNFRVWIKEEDKDFVGEFYTTLDQRNRYVFRVTDTHESFLSDIRDSKGILSNKYWPVLLSSFYAVQGFWLGKQLRPWKPALYRVCPGFISYSAPGELALDSIEESFQTKDIGKVVDFLYSYLSL